MLCLCFLLLYFLMFLKMLTVSVYLNHWAKVDCKLNHTLLTLKIHEWFFIVFKKNLTPSASPLNCWCDLCLFRIVHCQLSSPWGLSQCQLWRSHGTHAAQCPLSSILTKQARLLLWRQEISGEGFALAQFPYWNKLIIQCLLDWELLKGFFFFFFFKQGSITTDWSFTSFTADFVKEIHLECF